MRGWRRYGGGRESGCGAVRLVSAPAGAYLSGAVSLPHSEKGHTAAHTGEEAVLFYDCRWMIPIAGGSGCARLQRASAFSGAAAPQGCAATTTEFLTRLPFFEVTSVANDVTEWYYEFEKLEFLEVQRYDY